MNVKEMIITACKDNETAEFIAKTLKKLVPEYNFEARAKDKIDYFLKECKMTKEDAEKHRIFNGVYCTGYDEQYFQEEFEAGSSEAAGYPPFAQYGEVRDHLYHSLGNRVCDVLEAVFPLLPKEQKKQ